MDVVRVLAGPVNWPKGFPTKDVGRKRSINGRRLVESPQVEQTSGNGVLQQGLRQEQMSKQMRG